MEIPAKTLAGVKVIASYYVRHLCDRRETCSHDHSHDADEPQRSLQKDLDLIGTVERLAANDFSPVAPPVAAFSAADRDDEHGQDLGTRLMWLLRLYWRGVAERYGVGDAPAGGAYVGEESVDSAPT
jgi:hypothetical protein